MTPSAKTVDRVKAQQLCCGCGACAYVSPELYSLENVEDQGIRPVRKSTANDVDLPQLESDAYAVCPGHTLGHPKHETNGFIQELVDGWGPVLGVWEGHAGDEAIRFHGSSGGAINALAIFCMEQQNAAGTLHTVMNPEQPIMNMSALSTTRDEVLAGAGSRYSPASPCERLDLIENASGPCVFIGKPCDVAAVQKIREIRNKLDEKIHATIALFCAGTPSTNGTRAILKRMGIEAEQDIASFRYRGNGWPGNATAVKEDGTKESLTYAQSWGEILTKHVQWRCRVCIDHTGEFADIAVGDPWYRQPQPGETGDSLIVARTELGQSIIEAAIESGYLIAEKIEPKLLPASQPNLLKTRGRVWGRLLGSRLVFAGTPTYRRMPMFQFWLSELSFMDKVKSVVGTMRRIVTRRYLKKERR